MGLPTETTRPLRVAALVKQIPEFEVMEIGPDGRLQREGVPLEMSAYCRRAVAEGVLLAGQTGGSCTIFTLGPPSAEDVLREALAFGADDAVLVSDPAFAGSDSLATARALAAAIGRRDPFDLILVGRNSVDAETGQVGPELAQLLDLPFATGVKQLELDARRRRGCGPRRLRTGRLVARGHRGAARRAQHRRAADRPVQDQGSRGVGDGRRVAHRARDRGRPRTAVRGARPAARRGSARCGSSAVLRRRRRLDGPVADQVDTVVAALAERGLLGTRAGDAADEHARSLAPTEVPGPSRRHECPASACWSSPAASACCASCWAPPPASPPRSGGQVTAIGESLVAPEPTGAAVAEVLDTWGADEVVAITGPGMVEEDVAAEVIRWCGETEPDVRAGPEHRVGTGGRGPGCRRARRRPDRRRRRARPRRGRPAGRLEARLRRGHGRRHRDDVAGAAGHGAAGRAHGARAAAVDRVHRRDRATGDAPRPCRR